MSRFNVPVNEYTTPDPITANADTSIWEIAKLMESQGVRHLPILNGNKVVGVISERDVKVITCLNLSDQQHILAQDLMSVDPVTVTDNTPLDEVAYLMSDKKIGSVIVNDENDQFMGIFTLTDALNALIEIAREQKLN